MEYYAVVKMDINQLKIKMNKLQLSACLQMNLANILTKEAKERWKLKKDGGAILKPD